MDSKIWKEIKHHFNPASDLQDNVTALSGLVFISWDKNGSFMSYDQMLDAYSVYE